MRFEIICWAWEVSWWKQRNQVYQTYFYSFIFQSCWC